MSNASDHEDRRTYPLGLLFLILTAAAILAAVVAPLVREIEFETALDDLGKLLAASIGCMLAGCLLGMIMGLYHFHRSTGVLVGMGVGAAIGPVAGLLMFVGSKAIMSLAPAMLIGSVILVLVAWAIRPPAKPTGEEVVLATEVPPPPAKETPLGPHERQNGAPPT